MTKQTSKKGTQETLQGVGHICYLDCGDGFTGVSIVQTRQTECLKYVQFFVNYPSIKVLKYIFQQRWSTMSHTLKSQKK